MVISRRTFLLTAFFLGLLNPVIPFLCQASNRFPIKQSVNFHPVQLDRPGGPMSFIPVHNQGNIGICYAETAAQLIDSYRFSHGDLAHDRLTSGLQAALAMSETTQRKVVDSGQVCPVVQHILETGSCDIRAVLDFHKITRKTFMAQVSKIHADYQSFLRKENPSDRPDESLFNEGSGFETGYYKQNQKTNEVTDGLNRFLVKSGLLSTAIPSRSDLAQLLAEKNVMVFIEGILSPSCKNVAKSKTPAVSHLPPCRNLTVTTGGGPDQLVRVIHAQLDQAVPQPVGIDYCSDLLMKGRSFRGIISMGRGPKCSGRDSGGWHASLIIGKRINAGNKMHQFRIRNSWGTHCHRRNRRRLYSPDWECDHGNIWVDEESLKRSLRAINYIQ